MNISVPDVISLIALGLVGCILVAGVRERVLDFVEVPFRILAQPFGILERALREAVEALAAMIANGWAALGYGPRRADEPNESKSWFDILGPIVYLALCIVVGGGDFYVLLLRLAALFRIPVDPPAHLDLILGVIWTGTLVLWGLTWFDFLGVTPIRRPFNGFSLRGRRVGAIVTGLATLLSLVAGTAIVLFGHAQVWAAPLPEGQVWAPPAEPILGWLSVGLFALLLSGALAAAGWSIPCGIAALWLLVLMVIRLILQPMVLLALMIRRTIEGLGRLPGAAINIPADLGTMVWNWFVRVLGWRLELKPLRLAKRRPTAGDDGSDGTEEEVEEEISKMPSFSRRQINFIIGFDDLTRVLMAPLRRAADLCSSGTILAMGGFQANRPNTREQLRYNRGGVVDVSPTGQEIAEALAHSPSPAVASKKLICSVIDKLNEVAMVARLSQGQGLWLRSFAAKDSAETDEAIRELKTHQPSLSIVVLSNLPEVDQRGPGVKTGFASLTQLHQDGVIPVVFLFDRTRSPFAQANSAEVQDEFISAVFAELLIAHEHYESNPTLREMAERLGLLSSWAGLSFASKQTIVGDELRGYSFLRHILKPLPARGHGDLHDVLTQAQTATEEALNEPSARGTDEAIALSEPCFAVYGLPIRRDDRRWLEFVQELRIWLGGAFPNVIPVFVSDNGTPNIRRPGTYWVQCSILYPLPAVPTALARSAASGTTPLPAEG